MATRSKRQRLRRANGTNPRALGTNPRAKGTNPRAGLGGSAAREGRNARKEGKPRVSPYANIATLAALDEPWLFGWDVMDSVIRNTGGGEW